MKSLDSKVIDIINDNFWNLISDENTITLTEKDWNLLNKSIPEYNNLAEDIENPVIYYNLGQCTGHRVCYLRSTDVERNNWHRILWSIPDEMLYFMSLNKKIIIYDKSKHKYNKIERILIPVLKGMLNDFYFSEKMKNKYLISSLKLAYKALTEDKSLYKKYKLWKGKIKNIDINVKTIQVDKEPNIIHND